MADKFDAVYTQVKQLLNGQQQFNSATLMELVAKIVEIVEDELGTGGGGLKKEMVIQVVKRLLQDGHVDPKLADFINTVLPNAIDVLIDVYDRKYVFQTVVSKCTTCCSKCTVC